METPQYLLKLTQRLLVAGFWLLWLHFLWPGTYHKLISTTLFCFASCIFVRWELRANHHQNGKSHLGTGLKLLSLCQMLELGLGFML